MLNATVRFSQKRLAMEYFLVEHKGGGGGGRVTLKDDKEENEDFHEEGNMFYCLSQNRLENCK